MTFYLYTYADGEQTVVKDGHVDTLPAETREKFRPAAVIDIEATVGKSLLPDWLRNNAAQIDGMSAGGTSSIGKDMRYIADQIEVAIGGAA